MAYAPQSAIPWMANACTRPKAGPSPSFGGSFVGRMQYAPTRGHENAVRFVYSKAWHAPKAAYFSGNTAKHAPTAAPFSHATTVKQFNALRFTYFTE